jgi:hypothetical protein
MLEDIHTRAEESYHGDLKLRLLASCNGNMPISTAGMRNEIIAWATHFANGEAYREGKRVRQHMRGLILGSVVSAFALGAFLCYWLCGF